jgi:hypothetical protein
MDLARAVADGAAEKIRCEADSPRGAAGSGGGDVNHGLTFHANV